MKFRLKSNTARKLREQLYLGLFLAFVIWVLMALLFAGDSNYQPLIIYIAGSLIIIPYLYKNHVRPYMDELARNIQSAFFEIENGTVTFSHFNNVKQFDQRQITFRISDIINLKKAYRKDESVNKITLTIRNDKKVNVVVENFENMEEMVEILMKEMRDCRPVK